MGIQEAVDEYKQLDASERREFLTNVNLALPPPDEAGLKIVWIIVVSVLGAVAILGGLLTFVLIRDGKNAEAIVAFVSAALGALVGLIAPSPAGSSGGGSG
jgi:hypothetical protein